MATINDLPEEILEYILCLISPYNDLRSCRQVCQRWYTCCQGVVDKRKSRLVCALRRGRVEWQTPRYTHTHTHTHTHISRRYSHSACTHRTHMYVFGGCTSTNTTFNDLWRYDLYTHAWTRLLTTGTYPSPKAYATMIVTSYNNEDLLILFGGWTHPSLYPLHQQWVLFSELHIYNVMDNRWTQLYYPGSPPPTAGHTATMHGNVMVVFGGLQKQGGTSASTNDLFCLDLVNQCWYKPIVSQPLPQPRYGHSQMKLDRHHILIIAGCGGSNKPYNDVWILTIPSNIHDTKAVWTWKQVTILDKCNQPPHMWYTPCCKVGNTAVVVLSTTLANTAMSQLLVPPSVRRQPWIPPPPPPPRPNTNTNTNNNNNSLLPSLM
ncbi:hypothetical protein Pcinc_025023 [Petrolisthes cinctipes]|uniref:F-box domain-containing protein n=1 Tax=Petrolisthes cinctipes TaxID=88211 RepID=A0AAE1F9M5_PETCI|nr:hypothetical protein Pcinc_025023 [Petrolisthes cinctipes]